MQFEWDSDKNELNKSKHGISFEDARYVFADPLHREFYDEQHSIEEERWIIIGNIGCIVVVVVTYRENDTVRIISARAANGCERRLYEDGE
ncbi:hypothetical protein FACS1894200_00570 [Spirochaetia bacterium]|nr:hypothetical protein FACS1894200_00570 [Spirochaetia bacterium]